MRESNASVMEQVSLFTKEEVHPRLETYSIDRERGLLVRCVVARDGTTRESSVPLPYGLEPVADVSAAFDAAWLRSTHPPTPTSDVAHEVRIVDLFSGCGAMTLGVVEACRALGLQGKPILAVDLNQKALEVYSRNFPTATTYAGSIESLLDSELGAPPSDAEKALQEELDHIHIALGGPPCQGHSDLNNHTRRRDPRNALYAKMARFAEVVGPDHIIIENVPGVVHDRSGVAHETRLALQRLGYHVTTGVIRADEIGVPQRRRRFFTVASKTVTLDMNELVERFRTAIRTIAWACADLSDKEGSGTFDTPANHAPVNQRRIEYLFEHDLYDLPDSERPDCHRLKKHSYRSVYGRLRWEEPAPTITTGFGSTGQGRFVHPANPRTLTPHEAARLQFIPDFFDFGAHGRVALQEMIGNAVPPKMSYIIALELLR